MDPPSSQICSEVSQGVMVASSGRTIMESSRGRSNLSSTKTERKVNEKNRRYQMKTLYSKLNSLLPDKKSTEKQPLPDQIDEAISYIKSLEIKLEETKEKKESLTFATPKSPKLKIQETGSALEIVFTCGLDNQFLFYEIISILHEEGVEVVSANSQALGDSFFHVVHAQMKESAVGLGAARVTGRVNRLINGSTCELELDSEQWD
ncbi:PREDICTED: transcription factor bHLH118-like [Populus euphratica]|uniref:Transcription factor bHLH118-like n=1 Tax=Populus euphratica TaxID=75702 RepID=A0AAJ6XJQ4_POPEU|nr:PREDICTED: transcription factor bHLH118-like [Populus euphratica]